MNEEGSENGSGEKDGHDDRAVENELLEASAGIAGHAHAVSPESGPQSSLRALQKHPADEKQRENNLNVGKDVGHGLTGKYSNTTPSCSQLGLWSFFGFALGENQLRFAGNSEDAEDDDIGRKDFRFDSVLAFSDKTRNQHAEDEKGPGHNVDFTRMAADEIKLPSLKLFFGAIYSKASDIESGHGPHDHLVSIKMDEIVYRKEENNDRPEVYKPAPNPAGVFEASKAFSRTHIYSVTQQRVDNHLKMVKIWL